MGIAAYGEGLQYWLLLLKNERSSSKKADLQIKIERYIQRAEELKRQLLRKPQDDTPKLSNPTTSYVSRQTETIYLDSSPPDNIDELIRKCSTTPQLKLGLEILQSAESYEK